MEPKALDPTSVRMRQASKEEMLTLWGYPNTNAASPTARYFYRSIASGSAVFWALDRAHQDERYLRAVAEMACEPNGYYLVAELRESGVPVGTCCAFPEGTNYDVGYCILKSHWRQGLGTEMLRGLLGWIRDQGGRSVTGEIADGNAASVALATGLGFAPFKATRYKKWGEEKYFDAHWYRLELR